ncbi:putative adenylate cyclase regulatory protein [Eucalyptus grandis]|uniref:putative adenylate cyclase regulatory protein n=1 Tax=Eucalyptus grandis TaxID=71139 RepID=UPI00192EE6CD|nr:putative adenylate cyclase regulatory protein [Eucalyptus grandis]
MLELPNTIVNLESLKVLKMNGTSVKKLPEAIGMMEKLEEIHGNDCKELKMIPSDIGRLPLLKILALTATIVENVPELPQSLISLCLSSRAVGKVPEIYNRVNLPSLRNLELCFGKDNDETFVYYESERQPHAFSSSRMKLLNITSVTSFGAWFHCARELELIRCETLCQIQHLPSGLRKLKIRNCSLLEVVDLSNLGNLLELSLLNNQNCHIQGHEDLALLQHLKVYNCRSSKFNWLERLKNLRHLQLKMCPSLQTLSNLSNLKNLKEFKLWDCPKLVDIEGLDRLESLEKLDNQCCSLLDLSHSKKLKNLRQIEQLPSGLRKLTISYCHLLEVVDLSNLENLLELSLINSEICDIQGLEGLASLQCLRVYDSKSSKFNRLERLKNLRLLELFLAKLTRSIPLEEAEEPTPNSTTSLGFEETQN